jgi:hypothetical protein
MNNLGKTCVLAISLGIAGLGTARAQDLAAKVSVPFPFRAGAATLPAGEYDVVRENGAGLVLIQGRRGSALLIAEPELTGGASAIPGLTFSHSPKGNVLTEIHSNSGSLRLVQIAR